MRRFSVLWSAIFAVFLLAGSLQAAEACNKTFTLYNRSDNSIVQLYVAPHSSDVWEDDVLQNTTSVEPDMNRRINMSADTRDVSLYDVRAIFDDGTKVVGGKINLCRAQSIYIYDSSVTFSN
jgi:hypothetical protein